MLESKCYATATDGTIPKDPPSPCFYRAAPIGTFIAKQQREIRERMAGDGAFFLGF